MIPSKDFVFLPIHAQQQFPVRPAGCRYPYCQCCLAKINGVVKGCCA